MEPQSNMNDEQDGEKVCAVCRTARPREALLRFVRGPKGELAFDVRKKAPGRGTSVCARGSCLGKLKGCTKKLVAQVRDIIGTDVLNTLGLVRRQNRLAVGADTVRTLLSTDGGSCAFMSTHAADRTQREVRLAAEKSEEQRGLRVVVIPASFEALGKAVGRDSVGVLGVDAVTLRRGMCAGLREKAVLWSELTGSLTAAGTIGEGQNG